MKKYSFFQMFMCLLAIGTLTFTACSKTEVAELQPETLQIENDQDIELRQSESSSDDIKYIYKLNNREVRAGTFDPSDESLQLAIFGNGETNEITFEAFSTEAAFIEYGERNGYPIGEALEMEKHLAEYSEKSGAVGIYERTGDVPQWYTDYVNEYMEKHDLDRHFDNEKSSGTSMLRKDPFCSGSSAPCIGALPFMWPGWNNQTSGVFPFHIYGIEILFDRWFFRRRMAILIGWGWQCWDLGGPLQFLDNRASSWIS